MTQRVASGFVIASQKVDIEDVFPRPSSHWPRLDLAQADVAQRKYTQRFKQRAWQVLHLERDGSLVRSPRNQPPIIRIRSEVPTQIQRGVSNQIQRGVPHFSLLLREVGLLTSHQLSNQKEPRKVPLVVLNPRLQDLPRILPRRLASRDSGAILQSIRGHMFHAAGSVIKRNSLDPRMLPEKPPALVGGRRMRQPSP